MKYKKLLTISLVFSFLFHMNPTAVLAEEISSATEENLVTANEDDADEQDESSETENIEEVVPEEENTTDGNIESSEAPDEAEENTETDESSTVEDSETKPDYKPHIEIRGIAPTTIVNKDGYLREENQVQYITTFETDKNLSLSEMFSIILDDDNKFYEAEKSILSSIDSFEKCPEELSIDLYYDSDMSIVEKVKTSCKSRNDKKGGGF